MLQEVQEVARNAFTKEILFNILKDIEQRYKKLNGNHYQLKIGFELLDLSQQYEVEQLNLHQIDKVAGIVILHTKLYSFEIYVSDPHTLARLLVREYNVYSCIETIKNPDSLLWLSGLFFYWFLKSASSNNKSSALSASIHPLFGIITYASFIIASLLLIKTSSKFLLYALRYWYSLRNWLI